MDRAGSISGSISYQGGLVDFDVRLTQLGFSGQTSLGSHDVEFTDLVYSATGLSTTLGDTAADFGASGTAHLAAGLDQTPGGTSAYDRSGMMSLDCQEVAFETLACSLVLSSPFFPVTIGGNPSISAFMSHTLSLTAVPEPAPLLSVLAGSSLLLARVCAGRWSRP